jgi:hypothetical protein
MSVIFLQSLGYTSGGQFGAFLDSLAQMGFFSYVLPFLLLFALIYGILLRVKIFKDKNSINGLIALAVALLALQFDIVPIFFSEIFPRLGIGLAIILVILILLGLFLPNQAWVGYVLFGISALTILVILYQSAQGFGSNIFYWLGDYWPLLFGIGFVILVIVLITREKKQTTPKTLGEILPHLKYEA